MYSLGSGLMGWGGTFKPEIRVHVDLKHLGET